MSKPGKKPFFVKPIQKAIHFAIVLLFVAAATQIGCRRGRDVTPPDTYPVKGRITVSKGRLPSGCLIQFTPNDPKRMAEGIIAEDGTFTLQTRYEGVVCEGAAEGDYEVIIIPPLEPNAPLARPLQLPRPVHIKPEPNELTIPL